MRKVVEQYAERAEMRQSTHAAWTAYRATGLHATAEEADAWLAKLEAGEDAQTPGCHG
jgi:predicted transcriptional regulator